ncbi:MAG: AAA family ATPase [Rhizobiaceae bacterium]|nr:AAA family ATPase [Rhizobiaceae bacterium]
MSDIENWLAELGLQKYLSAFLDAEIDFDTLTHLGKDDLEELGLPLGPRRKVWGAIQTIWAPETAASSKALPSASKAQSANFTEEAERRQLTVMFCDVAGSTALSESLDPEELRDLMLAYQEVCLSAIQQFGGHLAKYLGDGVLAYFGYPTAHEDDPIRSVRAGLALLASIRELNVKLRKEMDLELGVRIGIHTGLVIAGEMGAGDVRESDAIVGETPNIAARLEGLATSGNMVIGPLTRRLIGDSFQCTFLGDKSVKGISTPIPVYSVDKERATNDAILQSDAHIPNQLFGRKEDLNQLTNLWKSACGGDGRLALISGEAGVGKSRLAQEFLRLVSTDNVIAISLQGSPLHNDTPLYPVKICVQALIGIDQTASIDAKLTGVEDWLRDHEISVDRAMPALLELLSLPGNGRIETLSGSPQFKKREIYSVLMQTMAAVADEKSLLLLVEDAHWIDPSTLGWTEQFLNADEVSAKFILATARSHFKNPWMNNAAATVLTLERLGEAAATEVIQMVFKDKALPSAIISQLLEKADGVPLFVEELSKSVRDSGALIERETDYVLSSDVALTIPSSLQNLLMARLDRLELGKGVAQIGSAIGRQFARAMIENISTLEPSSLTKAFVQLLASDLVEAESQVSNQILLFRHALVRDAAYESMLKKRRKQLHKNIADLIDGQPSGVSNAEPAEIADHRQRAEQFDEAIVHWLRAARLALSKGANVEAINQLQNALQCIERLPDAENTKKTGTRYSMHDRACPDGNQGMGCTASPSGVSAGQTIMRGSWRSKTIFCGPLGNLAVSCSRIGFGKWPQSGG